MKRMTQIAKRIILEGDIIGFSNKVVYKNPLLNEQLKKIVAAGIAFRADTQFINTFTRNLTENVTITEFFYGQNDYIIEWMTDLGMNGWKGNFTGIFVVVKGVSKEETEKMSLTEDQIKIKIYRERMSTWKPGTKLRFVDSNLRTSTYPEIIKKLHGLEFTANETFFKALEPTLKTQYGSVQITTLFDKENQHVLDEIKRLDTPYSGVYQNYGTSSIYSSFTGCFEEDTDGPWFEEVGTSNTNAPTTSYICEECGDHFTKRSFLAKFDPVDFYSMMTDTKLCPLCYAFINDMGQCDMCGEFLKDTELIEDHLMNKLCRECFARGPY